MLTKCIVVYGPIKRYLSMLKTVHDFLGGQVFLLGQRRHVVLSRRLEQLAVTSECNSVSILVDDLQCAKHVEGIIDASLYIFEIEPLILVHTLE